MWPPSPHRYFGTVPSLNANLPIGPLQAESWRITPSPLGTIAPGEVDNNALAEQAVTAGKLAGGAVTAGALANGCVTRGKLAEDAVDTRNLWTAR